MILEYSSFGGNSQLSEFTTQFLGVETYKARVISEDTKLFLLSLEADTSME